MSFSKFLKKRLLSLPKTFFAERTIVFVTSSGIKNFTLSPLLQFFSILLVAWIVILLQQSIRYDSIIESKHTEIQKLKSINKYFEAEFDALNDELKKVNDYLNVISGDNHSVSNVQKDSKIIIPEDIKSARLSSLNSSNIDKIKKISSQINKVELFTLNRIKELEEGLNLTGLDLEIIPKKNFLNQSVETPLYTGNDPQNLGQGGPLQDDYNIDKEVIKATSGYDFERISKKIKFNNKVSHLIFLENLVSSLPLNKPMKDFYISSSFGYRKDPLTNRRALHRGQDFVGPINSKILSPSRGKVILAGYFAEYGKAVVIDHGFGITTRYGHMSKILVSKGDIIEKGTVIGLQGNTGRSTGRHLHYEVRYKNNPLNPRKFIKAGEFLFDDATKNNITNYVDS